MLRSRSHYQRASRTKVINYIRTFLTSRRFMEVETPTLWPSVGPWPILP